MKADLSNVFGKIINFAILFLLSTSSILLFLPGFANAQSQTPGANWNGPWADYQNTNASPQNQITPSNVANLQVAWLFPFPAYTNPRVSALIFGRGPYEVPSHQGPGSPPLIQDGIVYELTQNFDIYAFDAASGRVIWHYVTPFPPDARAFHKHAIRYYDGKIWLAAPGNGYEDVLGVDALTGDLKVNISGIAANIPGQRYTSNAPINGKTYSDKWLYTPEWPPTFYKNIAFVPMTGNDLIYRGFVAAYDITTGKLLWRFFIIPPAPNCDPNWDFEDLVQLGNGTFVNYGQPKGNVSPYKGDWGTDCSINGAAGPWDSPAVDTETGVFYFQTSSAYPTGYAGGRPGPNLFADSIIALNATTGKMLWFFQATTRDIPGENDCQWSAALIVVNGRKEIATPCRNYFYGL